MSSSTSSHRFHPTNTTEQTLDDFGDIGITMRDEVGKGGWYEDDFDELWKEIGRVTVRATDGLIELWPFTKATIEDRDVLRGAGVEAFATAPSRKDHWTLRRSHKTGAYWECVLSIPALHDDLQVRVIRAAQRHHEAEDRAFTAHYDALATAPEEFGSAA